MTTHQDAAFVFPFGQPVLPYQHPDRGPRRVFVLGAYPSALHVRWQPPAPLRPITAVAVDNEPSPFWDGQDEVKRVEDWKLAVEFNESWGQVQPAGRFNGSSGLWVNEQVLKPLAIAPHEVWFSDCLDTYRCSKGLAARLDDTYRAASLELPAARLRSHPSEGQIVAEALNDHRQRLLDELTAAQPAVVVTLGNAALSVLGALAANATPLPKRLTLSPESYGQRIDLTIAGLTTVGLFALAHPGAPASYKALHQSWIDGRPSTA